MKQTIYYLFASFFLFCQPILKADDGYRLWLRYDRITDIKVLEQYNKSITGWKVDGNSPVLSAAAKELQQGLDGMLGRNLPRASSVKGNGVILAGTPLSSPVIASLKLDDKLKNIGNEGLYNNKHKI